MLAPQASFHGLAVYQGLNWTRYDTSSYCKSPTKFTTMEIILKFWCLFLKFHCTGLHRYLFPCDTRRHHILYIAAIPHCWWRSWSGILSCPGKHISAKTQVFCQQVLGWLRTKQGNSMWSSLWFSFFWWLTVVTNGSQWYIFFQCSIFIFKGVSCSGC